MGKSRLDKYRRAAATPSTRCTFPILFTRGTSRRHSTYLYCQPCSCRCRCGPRATGMLWQGACSYYVAPPSVSCSRLDVNWRKPNWHKCGGHICSLNCPKCCCRELFLPDSSLKFFFSKIFQQPCDETRLRSRVATQRTRRFSSCFQSGCCTRRAPPYLMVMQLVRDHILNYCGCRCRRSRCAPRSPRRCPCGVSTAGLCLRAD